MSEETAVETAENQNPAGQESAIPADSENNGESAPAEQIPPSESEQLPPPPEEVTVPTDPEGQDGSPAPETPVEPEPVVPDEEVPSDENSGEEQPSDDNGESVEEIRQKVTIKVNPRPHKSNTFNPNDVAAKKAWIAQKHQSQQDSLIKNGYSPTATISIMRYMAQNHGYEQKNAKDHLVFTFERLARSIKYSIDLFDQNMSSMLAILIINANGHLSDRGDILRMPPEDSRKYVTDVIDHVWKTGGGNSMGTDMQRLKEYVKRALNLKFADGYAARAKYFFECVIDITMKTIDPFDGLFHTERMEIPPEVRKIMHLPEKKQYPKVQCPKCGKDMKWIFAIHKHICVNPLCEDYRPPREKRPRQDDGDGSPRPPRKQWSSGKPISSESGSDRFAKRYGNAKTFTPKVRKFGPKDADGNQQSFENASPFAALDKLKIADTPEAPTPEPADDPVADAPQE